MNLNFKRNQKVLYTKVKTKKRKKKQAIFGLNSRVHLLL